MKTLTKIVELLIEINIHLSKISNNLGKEKRRVKKGVSRKRHKTPAQDKLHEYLVSAATYKGYVTFPNAEISVKTGIKRESVRYLMKELEKRRRISIHMRYGEDRRIFVKKNK